TADQRELRARRLHRTAEEQRAAALWLFLRSWIGARPDTRLDLEVLRHGGDDAHAARRTEFEVRRDVGSALLTRRAGGGSELLTVALRRLLARSAWARVERHRLPTARTLRHSDGSQRAARVAHEADVHLAVILPPCETVRQRTRAREIGQEIRKTV